MCSILSLDCITYGFLVINCFNVFEFSLISRSLLLVICRYTLFRDFWMFSFIRACKPPAGIGIFTIEEFVKCFATCPTSMFFIMSMWDCTHINTILLFFFVSALCRFWIFLVILLTAHMFLIFFYVENTEIFRFL